MARDSHYFSPVETPRPYFYAPFRQTFTSANSIYFFLRSRGREQALIPILHREVLNVDLNAAAYEALPFAEYTEITMLPHKVAASFLATLGLVSLLLAGVGLYSVMAYAVSQRTQEIGIRIALGAGHGDVIRSVLGQVLRWTIGGLAAGALLAWISSRFISTMLVNVSAADPIAFVGAAVFLLFVALLAAYFPARRATRVDPIVALRCE
jgi:putative ABC transport system permease protein